MKQAGFGFDEQESLLSTTADNQTAEALYDDKSAAPYTLIKGYLNQAQQQALLIEAESYPMTRPELTVYGKSHPIPRSQVWFADKGCDYYYSGLFIEALPWPRYAEKLRHKLIRDYSLVSNGVLVNSYRDGTESMGWHSDDEKEIESGSDIASVTLGASRDFFIRNKLTKEKTVLTLNSGDLLIMHWPMQQHWEHALPKRMRVKQTRVNYTFRKLIVGFHQA
ncbi:alpha-ketoglutarate-dependent dioxygenase AlkB family protein [Shewanella kaireitica]|uniref:alpha-ketoglutarate-dependent dioxygenase AlkB family protein n=1 Tax=Shewanella kaireitica TaxID=212021 RepID=UPI00200DEAA8|nr:alpha-ketoglutarate-dependent dioxygenase AlkB [Shewanella kaireitica]MCL1092677.1 alpha-ketoglutarate-dependent dioxygenase AlkB [Shewanella kaireitica]